MVVRGRREEIVEWLECWFDFFLNLNNKSDDVYIRVAVGAGDLYVTIYKLKLAEKKAIYLSNHTNRNHERIIL